MLALEALQLYAPMGHAMGLGQLSSSIEDICFQVHTYNLLNISVQPIEVTTSSLAPAYVNDSKVCGCDVSSWFVHADPLSSVLLGDSGLAAAGGHQQ